MKILFLIAILCSFNVFALDNNEEIKKLKISQFYQPDILKIETGLTDGVRDSDHLKIYKNDNYLTRAVVIKAFTGHSFIKIYRLVDTFSVTDENLTVVGINNSIIPDYVVASINAGENFPAEIHLDMMKFDPVYKEAVENNLRGNIVDAPEPPREPIMYNTRIFASPISKAKLNDAKNINYGFNISNQDKSKIEFDGGYNYNAYSQADPFLKQRTTGSYYSSNNSLDINNPNGKFSYFAMMNFKRQRMGTIYPIKQQIDGGPAGVKYKFFKNEFADFSLSYIPVVEYRVQQVQRYEFDETTYETKEFKDDKVTNFLRHSFRFKMKLRYQEWEMRDVYFFKPRHDIANHSFEAKDCDMSNSFDFNYYLTEKFQFGYNNLYSYDIRLKRNNQLPSTNMIHTFNLNYSFTF